MSSSCTFSVEPSTSSQTYVLSFPEGLPPAFSTQSRGEDVPREQRLKLSVLRNPSERKQHQRKAQLESETMMYAGQSFGRDGAAARAAGTLLVGVHRKGSGTVQLLGPSQLLVMRPSVKEARVSLEPPGSQRQMSGTEGAARKRQLVSELGSAKAAKKQKAAAASAVSMGAVLNSGALGSDFAEAGTAAGEPSATREADRHPLHPPFDMSATTVDAAYPIAGGMVPTHVWESLDHKALKEAAKSAEVRARLASDPKMYPPCVLSELALKQPSSKADRAAKLRALLLLAYMLRFSTLRRPIKIGARRAGSGSASAYEHHPDAAQLSVPKAVWDQLLDAYTEAEPPREGEAPPSAGAARRRISPPMREKLAMHCLVVALVVGGGRLATDALASTLELTEQKCAFYLKQLGCAVAAGHAKLRLPLEFPKLGRGAPQRR